MTQETLESSQPNQVTRLGFIPNLLDSLKHIASSIKQESTRVRKKDLVTICAVPALIVILAVVALQPGMWMTRSIIVSLAFVSSVIYILARIGIVRSLNSRQTSLVFQLIVASFMAGSLFVLACLDILR